MWNKAIDTKPETFDVMSYEVSVPVLAYNRFTRKYYLATFWVFSEPASERWRENETGDLITVTHWQEITTPKD